jgi:hypothetical protein
VKHWQYHQPIYEECLRVLTSEGVLAWAGAKFCQHFQLGLTVTGCGHSPGFAQGMAPTGHVWVVQTKEKQPVEFRQRIPCNSREPWPLAKLHPCIKPPEEAAFVIEALTNRPDRPRLLLRRGVPPGSPATRSPLDRVR